MKSHKNLKNSFFSLCFIAQKNIFPKQFTRNLLLFYITAYVIHILSLNSTSIFKINYQISSTIFIALNGLIMLFAIQSFLFLLIGKEFYLAAQINLFRYTLMDQGVTYVIKQVINPSTSMTSLAILFYIFYIVIAFLMVYGISFENFQEKTLVTLKFSFSFYFYMFNLLLQLIDSTSHHALKSILIIFLIFCIYNTIENVNVISSGSWEKIYISIFVKITLIIALYLFFKHILSENINSYIFYFILLGIYIIVGILIRQRQKMIKAIDIESIQDTHHFVYRIQAIAFDIDSVLDGSKKFDETELKSYLSKHQQVCKITSCPLFGQEAKGQIKTLNQTKCIKSIVKKLRKHLQLLFQSRFIMNSEDTTLRFAFLSYLIFYSLHKRKAYELYNTLNKDYTIDKSYFLYQLKIKIENLEDEQSIISKNASSTLFQTYNQHSSNIIDLFCKICNILLQQKIDFNILTSITYQMSSERHSLDQFIQKIFTIETYGAYKILNLYRHCCKQLFQEHQKSQIIEKHLVNLIERLDHKKQVQFLSNRSQVGLVAISLSQSSLGNVFSINQYAQAVFGFEGKDLIGKTVNNIMPSTFATYHDSLLMVFLKNRNKRVNGDQRALVAKHKNGMIFPVMLRLQRVIVSSDELVFVANIRRYKTKESPLMFIATPQGDVVDCSAGFQYYFMKNFDKKINKINIYEITPNFDEVTQKNVSNFSISYEYRPGSIITVDFKVTPLAFFGNLQAYYLFGTKTMQKTANSSMQIHPITNIFSQLIIKERLRCHKNNFITENNRSLYTIGAQLVKIDLRDYKNRQLTIPFIHLNQFSRLVQLEGEQNKNYAKGIKAIRLVKNHFEPVQQLSESSLQQLQSQEKGFFMSKRTVVSIDEIQKSCDSLSITQNLIFLITFLMIILNFLSFSIVPNVSQSKNVSFSQEMTQYKVRGYISDFILFSKLKKYDYNQSFYTNQFDFVQNRIVNVLEVNQMAEESKECYFRIIYSQTTWSTINNLFQKPYNISQASKLHEILWYGNISFIILLIITFIAYIWFFKDKIYTIYTYFLYLDESIIMNLLSKCQKLSQMSSGKESNINQALQSSSNALQAQQSDPTFIKKFKSFNNSSRKHDIIYIIQIYAFLIILGGILSALIAQTNIIESKIAAVSSLSIKLSQIQAQSSVQILSSFLLHSQSKIILNSNFNTYLQQLESLIIAYSDFEDNSTLRDTFDIFIAGNICSNGYFPTVNFQICQNYADSISTKGILSVLDFINSQIIDININIYSNRALQRLNTLTILQYQIIEPAIRDMNNILNQIKIDYESSFISIFQTICIIIVIILLMQVSFLVYVPFKNMKDQIKLVYRIIQLLESIKKSKQTDK